MQSQKHRPRDAEVAVHYRGYWYYIACDDVSSRAVMSVLEILFSLEESAERGVDRFSHCPSAGRSPRGSSRTWHSSGGFSRPSSESQSSILSWISSELPRSSGAYIACARAGKAWKRPGISARRR